MGPKAGHSVLPSGGSQKPPGLWLCLFIEAGKGCGVVVFAHLTHMSVWAQVFLETDEWRRVGSDILSAALLLQAVQL